MWQSVAELFHIGLVHVAGLGGAHVGQAVDVAADGIETEILNNKVALSWNLPDCIYDGFESGDLYQNMWINDQSCPWEITTAQPHEGSYCAKSTNQGMFTTSKLSLGVSVPTNCVVSYYARISCFPLNGGGFFIDNVQYGETIKDEVPWTRFSFPLNAGNHLLEWKYGNQLTEGEYENAFYIDDITVGNPFEVYRADCDGQNQVLLASGVTQADYMDYGWGTLPDGWYKYGISTDGGVTVEWSACIERDFDGVDESFAGEVAVFPNPATDQLTVECVGARRLTVISPQGQTLYHSAVHSDRVTLSLCDYPSGIYLIRIQSDRGEVTRSFSIVR